MNVQHTFSSDPYTVGCKSIQPSDVFPLTPAVNKSCNIECCVNNMLQIIQNMMFSQGLELELSMFRRTKYYIRSALVSLGQVNNFLK